MRHAPEDEFTELTEAEIERYGELRRLMDGEYENARPGMLRVKFDDLDAAVIVAAVVEDNGSSGTYEAVALLLDENLMDRITAPDSP